MAWHVWNTFLSVAAYGIVKNDTLILRSPWEGKIAQLNFREGQTVVKGDLLATLDSALLERKLDRLQDELQVEQAKLEAESMRLSQEAHTFTAQYFQMWATLQKNREELSRMQIDLEQIKAVGDSGVISKQALNRLVFSESGQREFVEKITSALDELRSRIHSDKANEDLVTRSQLKPIQARIDYLNGEIRRTRVEIREGEMRSPVSGVVVSCRAAPGQCVISNEPLIEIVDKESSRIELFVPQTEIDQYTIGKEIRMTILPHVSPVTCKIVGSRNRFESAPDAIRQFYTNRETLMPVLLEPQKVEDAPTLFAGSVTRFTFLQRMLGP